MIFAFALQDLVQYYTENSLQPSFPDLNTTLLYPFKQASVGEWLVEWLSEWMIEWMNGYMSSAATWYFKKSMILYFSLSPKLYFIDTLILYLILYFAIDTLLYFIFLKLFLTLLLQWKMFARAFGARIQGLYRYLKLKTVTRVGIRRRFTIVTVLCPHYDRNYLSYSFVTVHNARFVDMLCVRCNDFILIDQ